VEDETQLEQDGRRADVRNAMKVMHSPMGLGVTVDVEDAYLLLNAVRCYIGGADAGTIFCAHATCERDLAALVRHTDPVPKHSARWGLGGLVQHFESLNNSMPSELLGRLRALNDHRKTLYHYGHSEAPSALRARTYDLIEDVGSATLRDDFRELHDYQGDNKDIITFAMDRVLKNDALAALTTSLMLRSWLTRR